ncbi:MAG: ABC transporter substrate-binding protein [Deltaproteobacteria bacterium]|nr:ABC transporter substrate-binding protein [Deltaproteobacteria bacterium]
MDRRAFLGFALAAAATPLSCTRPSGVPGTVRIGFLANVTHAPMIVALASGAIARALPGVTVETRTFRAGPRVCEALLGNAIDIGVSGPGPLVATHARHTGDPFALLSGVASGGASLITLPWVKSAHDLAGTRVSTPQIGSTQDISLRKWLARNGLVTKERGGDVVVDAMASSNVMEQMRRGRIAAAWLPEPWATRVVVDLGATRMLDERELWSERRFPTALLVARRPFLDARRRDVDAVVVAVQQAIARATRDPSTKVTTFAEIKRLTGKGLPPGVADAAWSRVDFAADPMPAAIAEIARDAFDLGYVPRADVNGLVAQSVQPMPKLPSSAVF